MKLAGIIKSARDVMRKDAALSGEVDRIPQLSWLLFLRAYDALEARREVTDRDFRPAIEAPYRWRDWAAESVNGLTGDELIEFVNGDLLPHLRDLRGVGAGDPRDVLAAVFKETFNRMLSGYLLRDVVNKVNEINFASSDDIHTMAYLYETMLREMRDAAGTSGEFYTPRPVIRFIVQQVDPQLGEAVLDPACGTGGFLVETMDHVRSAIRTAEQLRALDRDVRGIEKKPLPYLLGMMNLLLHDVQDPHIVRDNALGRPLSDIRKSDRVDVVLTNPPFGGEEERGIQSNFPEATRTSETALLFLQLVQRVLAEGGRCGIVVPNRVLFGDGTGARIKQRLLDDCNLHTIVRLPSGVFEPYTDIPTNIFFFEKTGRTKSIWYYQVPIPQDRRKYSKTKPLLFEEFDECRRWWGGPTRKGRKQTSNAWQVSRAEIEAVDFDLDQRNPHQPSDLASHDPSEVSETAEELTRRSGNVISSVSARLRDGELERALKGGSVVELGEILEQVEREEVVDATKRYRIVGVYSFGKGVIDRGTIEGASTGYRVLTPVQRGDLVISKLGAWEGAIAVVPEPFDGTYVSQEFPIFRILDEGRLRPAFLDGLTRSPGLWRAIDTATQGSMARRKRVQPAAFLKIAIWLPEPPAQSAIGELLESLSCLDELEQERRQVLASLRPAILNRIARNSEE